MKALLSVLGSGTSMGVPTIGCPCEVCHSEDPHDKRTRPSILLQYGGRTVMIDATPDFRFQALRAGMCRLDAILLTHSHADHILGLDDVRPFNFLQKGSVPVYSNQKTLDYIRAMFKYIFEGNYPFGGLPQITTHALNGPLELFGATFTPVPVRHGFMEVLGYRFGRTAYLTDYGEIPESSFPLLEGLDYLFLDALRHEAHPTHCTVERALQYVDQFRPKQAYFTHIAHDLSHIKTNAALPPYAQLAHDGLQLEIEL